MYLARILTQAVTPKTDGDKAQWIADNAIDPLTGEKPFIKQRAWRLMTKPRTSFLDPDQFRALCSLFGWAPEFLRDVCLQTIGITIPARSGSTFAAMLPPAVDKLDDEHKILYRNLILLGLRDKGLMDR